MLRKQPDKQQETNNSHIFGANALGVLKSSRVFTQSGGLAGIGLIAWAATLPLSLLSSVIKSIADINTRTKMPASDLDATIGAIEVLNNKELNKLVTEISKYEIEAKSNSSQQIFTRLRLLKQQHQDRITKTQSDEETMIIQQKESAINQELQDFALDKEYVVNARFSTTYKLSHQEKILAEEKLKEKLPSLEKEHQKAVKETLVTFLKEPYNAGKKLQHVIKDAADHAISPSYFLK